jgi:transcription antitermination factor NusG
MENGTKVVVTDGQFKGTKGLYAGTDESKGPTSNKAIVWNKDEAVFVDPSAVEKA